jgi:uncharacterized protein (TIGR02246 family)
MDRRAFVGLTLVLGGCAMTATGQGQPPHSLPAEDVEAINAVIAAYERTWNASDLTGMGALYTPDIHWVNVKGMHWRGFDEVDRAHRVFFDLMFKGVPCTLEGVDSLTAIAPGVAAAVVVWRMGAFRTPDGHLAPAARNRMTLIFAKTANGWKIAHGHNIEIDEQAAPNDPIRGKRTQSS